MASPLAPSRDATPSSSSSLAASMDQASNPSASGSSQGREEVDRFLKRMDMEKKLQSLQQRLELASVKASHGWGDMSMEEIEDRLPTHPRRRSLAPIATHASPSRLPYEPPSPSRPWQLIDVLWQPLPPPSRGPLSPRKRPRDEDANHGHRRAISAAHLAFPDPVPARVRKEKRSQSHSYPTIQDVDAAKALTSMLAAPPMGSASLPIPHSPEPPPRQRAQSLAVTPDRGSSRISHDTTVEEERGEEDKNAAELMMYLAHSPSPMKRFNPGMRSSPTTARVLFSEGEKVGKSNLAMPPITAGGERRSAGFGALLGGNGGGMSQEGTIGQWNGPGYSWEPRREK